MEKRYIMYILITIVCVISLCIGIYAQIFYKDSDTDKLMIGVKTETTGKIEKEDDIKDDFNNIFENKLVYAAGSVSNKAVRRDMGKDLIYTINQVSKTEKGKYEMNINIPTVNIVSEVAEKINTQIEQIFLSKATEILTSNSQNYVIYNVNYIGYVNSNIMSLAIKATLKEGNNPQRAIFMTYNYDLNTGKIVTLNEMLAYRNISSDTLQNKINKEIQEIAKKTEDLKNIGYTVYTRTPSDTIYKVSNTTTFFMGKDAYIYVLYAYGNNHHTSEVDVIII